MSTLGRVRVLGMRDPTPEGFTVVDTTSRATGWSRSLSPFLVPAGRLYGGYSAVNVENAWQFSKVYPQHDWLGRPTAEYFEWAREGWADTFAHRYPMGKGAAPLYSWWGGRSLGYVEARKNIYVPLYRRGVVSSSAWKWLAAGNRQGVDLALRDFDGYDHKALGISYADVLNDPGRKMGHAFVLASMLDGEA